MEEKKSCLKIIRERADLVRMPFQLFLCADNTYFIVIILFLPGNFFITFPEIYYIREGCEELIISVIIQKPAE